MCILSISQEWASPVLKKDFQFYFIVWENNPTPLLIYDLGKQFPNEKMNEIFILEMISFSKIDQK